MKLLLLTTLVMVAFAANSLLNRAALLDPAIGPGLFSLVRVLSGSLTLVVILALRRQGLSGVPKPNVTAVVALSAYLLGFSYAYVSMNAGLGALILFGGVQITMFAGALFGGERPERNRWIGMMISLTGLVVLVWPSGQAQVSFGAVALMGAAAIGWGIYSLLGRGVSDPIRATAWNFVFAMPVVAVVALSFGTAEGLTAKGLLLAVISGALTSGLGYALWYSILPALSASAAALAQLSVPAIAMILGVVLLGEAVTLTALAAATLILSGIAFGIRPSRKIASSAR